MDSTWTQIWTGCQEECCDSAGPLWTQECGCCIPGTPCILHARHGIRLVQGLPWPMAESQDTTWRQHQVLLVHFFFVRWHYLMMFLWNFSTLIMSWCLYNGVCHGWKWFGMYCVWGTIFRYLTLYHVRNMSGTCQHDANSCLPKGSWQTTCLQHVRMCHNVRFFANIT